MFGYSNRKQTERVEVIFWDHNHTDLVMNGRRWEKAGRKERNQFIAQREICQSYIEAVTSAHASHMSYRLSWGQKGLLSETLCCSCPSHRIFSQMPIRQTYIKISRRQAQ